jgi:hypothetical protein
MEVMVYDTPFPEEWSYGVIHHFWRDNNGDIQKLYALDSLHTDFMALQIIGQSFDDVLSWISGIKDS